MNKYILILLFSFSKLAFSQTEQSMFHGGETHNGVYTSENFKNFKSIKWTFKTNGKIFSSPAVVDGLVFIGSEDKNLYAVDAAKGKERWRFTTDGEVHSSPAVSATAVFFGSFDGYFYAVNKKNGKLKWKFKTGAEKRNAQKGLWGMQPADQLHEDPFDFYLSSPILSNGKVYIGSSDGNLYALDAETGDLIWKFQTKGLVHTSPAIYKGKIFIGSWDTYMYSVDAETGKELWKFKTGDHPDVHLLEGIQASATVYDGMLYFGARDGFFYALDTESGNLIWKFFNDNSWILTTASVKDGSVYFGTSDSYTLISADAKTGKVNWRYKANGYIYSSPALVGNSAFFGDFTGNMFAINFSTGNLTDVFSTNGRIKNGPSVLKKDTLDFMHMTNGMDLNLYTTTIAGMKKLYSLGSIISSPLVNKGVIYFGSADGNLYALNLAE